jgi:hypothetical protein
MVMNTRMRLMSLLAGLCLVLGSWGPASAAKGTGKITCDGDGTVIFTGEFLEISLSTKAGAVVYTKPAKGALAFSSGSNLVKYTSGDTTLQIGSGSAAAKNVKGIKLTLSGANARLEAKGTGKLTVRGEGACVTASGATLTWRAGKDSTLDVAP